MEMVVIPVTTLARVMRSRPCVFCNHIIHVRNLSCGLLNYSSIIRRSGHLDDPCLTDHPGQPENSCVRKKCHNCGLWSWWRGAMLRGCVVLGQSLECWEVSPEEEHHPPDVEQAGHEHTLYILLRWWWWWIIIFDEGESTWVIVNYLGFTQHAHFDHLGLFRSLFQLLSHFHLLQEICLSHLTQNSQVLQRSTDCDISPQVQAPYSWPPSLP